MHLGKYGFFYVVETTMDHHNDILSYGGAFTFKENSMKTLEDILCTEFKYIGSET